MKISPGADSWNHFNLAKAWALLACISLLVSGALAFVITAAKMPAVKAMVQDLDLIRWCLAIHVNLATLVWFTALPLALVHLSLPTDKSVGLRQKMGLLLAVVGVILFSTALPNPNYDVLLSNFVPVFTHPRFYWGMILYVLGVALNYLDLRILWPRTDAGAIWPKGLEECRFGLWVGGMYLLAALLTFALSLMEVRTRVSGAYGLGDFEVMMWGGGHLLQHASTVFLIVVWVLLISSYFDKVLFSRRELFWVFAWAGLPLWVTPILLNSSIYSVTYRQGFTSLMRWGIFPPVLLFLGLLTYKIIAQRKLGLVKERGRKFFKDYRTAGLVLSAGLMILGFIFGAFIRGSDMRVPGHYHASIGSVTLGFMMVCFVILKPSLEFVCDRSRWALRSVWVFGIGQMIFSSGMFTAGSFGMGRKTYGSEHTLDHWGQFLGFAGIAAGGLMAFAGGLLFAIAVLPIAKQTLTLRSSHARRS